MAIKISSLTNLASSDVDGTTDYLVIVDASTSSTGATKRISSDNLLKYVPRTVITFRADSGGSLSPGSTQYLHSAGFDAAENTAQMIMPITGTIKNLYVRTGTAPGGSATQSYTLMLDGSTTSLATTISGAALEASDLTSEVTLVAGNSLSLRVQSSTDATTAVGIAGAIVITG